MKENIPIKFKEKRFISKQKYTFACFVKPNEQQSTNKETGSLITTFFL